MAKFTDAVRATLTGYFNAGDQPTEAQFTALILAIQEGIEEHDHDGLGDGDGMLFDYLKIYNATNATLEIVGFADDATLTLNAGTDGGAVEACNINFQENSASKWTIYKGGDSHFRIYDFARAGVVLECEDNGDMYLMPDGGSVAVGVAAPLGMLHVDQSVNDLAIPVLVLDQADVSEGTINFIASDRGVIAGATASVESIRVEVNGVVRRIACYADA